MKVIKESDNNIAQIINVLDSGGLVIFPSETVYGAAVDATNPEAVNKLNTYKQRPVGKPYSIMVDCQESAERYVELNQTAKGIYKKFLPGPITVVSRGKNAVAKGVESEAGTLGVRIPKYDFLLKLTREFGKPLTATSANSSYKKRPYKIDDLLKNISQKQLSLIDLVIDAGELPRNEPSTVIDTTLDDVVVLRSGDIQFNPIEQVVSRNPESTQNLGKELWQKYESYSGQRAIVFALEGEMGSGKTQLTKGLAKAMGIGDNVVSPTFSLHCIYDVKENPIVLNHIDAWRLIGTNELDDLGFRNMISNKSVVVIEWADRVSEQIRALNEDAVVIWVKISYGVKEDERLISWKIL
jgi:L-threonylcarbamoyladenylate synthase